MRVGVAGTGFLGARHARKLALRRQVTDLVLHDLDPAAAAKLVAELGPPARAVADREAFFASCDAVVVAASTVAHAELSIAAFGAGCHVLVEKPIAVTLGEADAMIAAAAAADRVLMVGQIERFNPAIRRLEGRLGAPRFIEAHRLAALKPRSLDVDVVLDLMIHDIDLALHFMRGLPARIDAAGSSVLTRREDIANARLQFPGGGVANLTASRVSLSPTRKIRFFMPDQYVSVDCQVGRADVYRLEGDTPPEDGAGPEITLDLMERIRHEALTGEGEDALDAELSAFLAAARGAAPCPVPGADGRAALAVALEVLERLRERTG